MTTPPRSGTLSTTKELLDLADKLPPLKEDSFGHLRGIMAGGARMPDPGHDMVCHYHQHGKQTACEFEGKSFKGMYQDNSFWCRG